MGYNNPVPVVVAVMPIIVPSHFKPHENVKFLAVRRAISPFIGELAFPGGYVNENERAEYAIMREVKEETGIDTVQGSWRTLVTHCTPRNQLLIFMYCIERITADQLSAFRPNEEVSELALVTFNDKLCFPLHSHVLQQLQFSPY